MSSESNPMTNFSGNALFLDRNDINTDEIIPARYLTAGSKEELKSHLLEDLRLDGFDPGRDLAGKGAIITRANFGCGSSREHAVWALEANAIGLVIAESFARIFYRNMFSCGLLALQLPSDVLAEIFACYAAQPAAVAVDLAVGRVTISAGGQARTYPFALSDFDKALIAAGGWVNYADTRY
jgi:3-isopropylmalate/(R)-2-methylmalate dehydratase small subunit